MRTSKKTYGPELREKAVKLALAQGLSIDLNVRSSSHYDIRGNTLTKKRGSIIIGKVITPHTLLATSVKIQ